MCLLEVLTFITSFVHNSITTRLICDVYCYFKLGMGVWLGMLVVLVVSHLLRDFSVTLKTCCIFVLFAEWHKAHLFVCFKVIQLLDGTNYVIFW